MTFVLGVVRGTVWPQHAAAGLSGERLAREVRLAASLQHPNIGPVLTTGVADGIPYYTVPYVKGESLGARMKESPPLARRKAVSVLRDIARALEKTGDTARARAIRKKLDEMPDTTWLVHTMRAYAYLAVPDTAKALSEIEEGFARREIVPQAMFFVERVLDPVRHSARFAAIVRKAGLEGRGFAGPTGGRPAR